MIGADGKVELDLADPFQRHSARSAEGGAVDSDGMSATSLGEISEEFRILAIVIPKGDSSQPMGPARMDRHISH